MLVSIVTPCYNEEGNIASTVHGIRTVMEGLGLDYEHVVIDNASTDRTVEELRRLASEDRRLKVILNARNFGQIRSPYYATLATTGDVCINLPSDGEVPFSIIPQLIEKWREGYSIVNAVKESQDKSPIGFLKSLYQKLMERASTVEYIKNFSGYGLVDASIVAVFREMRLVYTFYRGLVSEVSGGATSIYYEHIQRKKGKSKNNLHSLVDYGLLGLVAYSKLPLSLALYCGLFSSVIAFGVGLYYLLFKLVYWDAFEFGLAPSLILMSFLLGVTLMLLAIVGEYVYQIFIIVRQTPIVVEKERINFGKD